MYKLLKNLHCNVWYSRVIAINMASLKHGDKFVIINLCYSATNFMLFMEGKNHSEIAPS